MYHSMRNKKPVQEWSQVVARQVGPLPCLHLLLILKQTKNLLVTSSVLGGRAVSAKLMAPPCVPSPVFMCGLWRGDTGCIGLLLVL